MDNGCNYMSNDFLNIYHICEESISLGPGVRFVIWVQGCMQRCKGCISPSSRSFDINQLLLVEDLAQRIIDNKNIQGITISGGEPFLQATNLSKLLKLVKAKRPDLNVLVYSGYVIEQLETEKAKIFLSFIDLLIDGPYVDKLKTNKGLRGSTNQRLHFLTDSLVEYEEKLLNGERNNEVFIKDGSVRIVGLPREGIDIEKFIIK